MSKKSHILSIDQIDIDQTMLPSNLPNANIMVIPTRDFVLFPDITYPISLGRDFSIATAVHAYETKQPVAILCQIDAETEVPNIPDDLYSYGVVAMVMKVIELPDGHKTAILHGLKTISVVGPGAKNNTVNVEYIEETPLLSSDKRTDILIKEIKSTVGEVIEKSVGAPGDLIFNIKNLKDKDLLINYIATNLPFDSKDKQHLLETSDMLERSYELHTLLTTQNQLLEMMKEIDLRTKQNISENQKAAFLQQQMEAIRQEIYGDDDDSAIFKKKIDELNLSSEVKASLIKETDKLSRLNPQSPDYAVQYSYLEMLTELPWNVYDDLNADLSVAETTLNSEHFGMEKVKERILEQLAVNINSPEAKSPIICLVGPPGVGKTSLGHSIADAMGRKFQRVSLGGVHDEAELRGHRRTYIGALPGRIMTAIKRAQTSNPLIMLDEIDKLGADIKGDPYAALLEILDPEQNCKFHDNYVDIDYDLSNVMFVCTANTLNPIPRPLLDRMEIVELSGYVRQEKIAIAQQYLLPKVFKENGVSKSSLRFDDAVLEKIIDSYTAESGVRQLEKQLSAIVRKSLLNKLRTGKSVKKITLKSLTSLLGKEKYSKDDYESNKYAGVVTGLAWTAIGGEILVIEASASQGKGEKLSLTGNLGDVMKESAAISLQYIKSHCAQINIDGSIFENYNIHIHVPEGAIPKDGPSAGITMTTALVSLFTGRKVKDKLAMTGEMTLRGRVLPVGGIKEKILAAKRAGINTIILSEKNRKDIVDINPEYISSMNFIFVNDIQEVINASLLDELAENRLEFNLAK